MGILKDVLPAKVRQVLYVAYAVLGVALGAIQVALDPDPSWLITTFSVYGFLGGALGLTAGANTDTEPGKHEA